MTPTPKKIRGGYGGGDDCGVSMGFCVGGGGSGGSSEDAEDGGRSGAVAEAEGAQQWDEVGKCGAEGGRCVPTRLQEAVELAGTAIGTRQPPAALQDLHQPQHRHLPLRGPNHLQELRRGAERGVAVGQQFVQRHSEGPHIRREGELTLLEALHGEPGGHLWGTLMGHNYGARLWGTLMGHNYGAQLRGCRGNGEGGTTGVLWGRYGVISVSG